MICKSCNKENPNTNQFCMYCGQNLFQDSNNYNNNLQNNQMQNYQTNYNYNYNNSFQTQEPVKKANIGLAILSWFIPLAGLIIFIVKKEKDPKTAKASGICALISFLLSFGATIFLFSITAYIINSNHNDINNTINDLWGTTDNNQGYYDDIYNNNNDNNYYEDNQEEQNNNINKEDNTNITNNWKDYKVAANGKELKLPATFTELNNIVPFNLKSTATKSYLQKGYYTLLNMYKNDKLALYIEITNDTEENKLYTDCKITRIAQSKYQVSQGADVITFPGNLKAGQEITHNEIIELLGNPNDTKDYSNDGYVKKTYKYFENSTWTTTNYYEIDVVNGIIDQITLDNRN